MARTISCRNQGSSVEYPIVEYKHYINESTGNMYNPIFKGNIQEENIQGGAHLQD